MDFFFLNFHVGFVTFREGDGFSHTIKKGYKYKWLSVKNSSLVC